MCKSLRWMAVLLFLCAVSECLQACVTCGSCFLYSLKKVATGDNNSMTNSVIDH